MAQLKTAPAAAADHLVVRGLQRNFAHRAVVRALDLRVPRGQFLALLGPSGCGKTTTLRMIAGFEQPDAGSIHLDGRLLSDASTHVAPELRGMGMVFQSYALWPHMSVAENVGYALRLRGMRGADLRRAVVQALEQVELADKADAMPHALSGGQKQRVALARCLAAAPRVILLDEPLANLDRHLRRTMESAFRRLHRSSGATFLYVTHDQGEAMALADEIAVLHEGQLVQRATPQRLYQQPRTAWLARFIGQGSVLHIEAPAAAPWQDGRFIEDCALLHTGLRHALQESRRPQRQVLVRPEHVTLIPSPESVDSAQDAPLPARVTDCVFKGERYEVELALTLPDACQQLLAFSPRPYTAGAMVGVRIARAWPLAQP